MNMVNMVYKLYLKVNIQSISDIITNSSSEIFCVVKGGDASVTNIVAKHLSYVLGRNITVDTDTEVWDEESQECIKSDNPPIMFSMEIGYDNDWVKEDFRALIKATLDAHFGVGVVTVEGGEDYN